MCFLKYDETYHYRLVRDFKIRFLPLRLLKLMKMNIFSSNRFLPVQPCDSIAMID